MDKEMLRRVLSDQREEILHFPMSGLVPRAELAQIDLDSGLAQIVIGVRRSGKSTLCRMAVRSSGRSFGYINFDDERLVSMRGEDLDVALEVLYERNGDIDVLFLDEVQNIPEWNLFVNRLLRMGKHLLITGSNAKLLSGELATHMTGRYHAITLFPLSFAEFASLRGIDIHDFSTLASGLRSRALVDYLEQGGFPELVQAKHLATTYIQSLIGNILERDIRQRLHLQPRSLVSIRDVSEYLLSVAPVTLNLSRLGHRLGLQRSPKTIRSYVDTLLQSYLLVSIRKWSPKSHLRIRNEKIYPVDVLLLGGGMLPASNENIGWRLETVVLLELLRRNHAPLASVFYFQENRVEADFLVRRSFTQFEVYQVAAFISENKVRAREIRGAVAAAKATGCKEATLITLDETGEERCDGILIHIVRADRWLCGG